MPPKLVPRPPLHYKFDSPLTERGQIVAETYGRGLANCGIHPFEVFCSPDMKSVQTAAGLVKGLGLSFTSINIEPALLTYRQMLPSNYQEMILSPRAFLGLGYPINLQYVPFQGLNASENIEEYNMRIQNFFRERISKIDQKLFVIVVSDNVMVDMTKNEFMETVDDILKSTKKATCQMNFISLKPGEVHFSIQIKSTY
uniref:Elongator complex protein 5 n=1 Tax=Caenorhabditis tropicalis TaxID=1561998 RepID=A0A1I7UYC7_9PELO